MRLARIVVELAVTTVALWILLLVTVEISKWWSDAHIDAPELIFILVGISLWWAVRVVARLERF